jgi:hypothetical protein
VSKFNITITNDEKPFMTINCDAITVTQDSDGIYIHVPFDQPIVKKDPNPDLKDTLASAADGAPRIQAGEGHRQDQDLREEGQARRRQGVRHQAPQEATMSDRKTLDLLKRLQAMSYKEWLDDLIVREPLTVMGTRDEVLHAMYDDRVVALQETLAEVSK